MNTTTETEIVSIDYKSTIKEIAQLFSVGISSIRQAGELLVKLYDANPIYRELAKNDLHSLPSGMLDKLERIGRNKLLPEVMQAHQIGFRRLEKMPFDIQKTLIHAPVEIVVINDDGRTDILKVRVKDMSKDQAKQVFSDNGVRDPSAQRAYLADIKMKSRPKPVESAFKLLKDRLVINEPCEITRQQLTSLLAQMG